MLSTLASTLESMKSIDADTNPPAKTAIVTQGAAFCFQYPLVIFFKEV